jgi:hypothetical protein
VIPLEYLSQVYEWLHRHDINTVLGLIATVLAVKQYVDTRRLDHQLTELKKSSACQFLGKFPLNMEQIVDVVRDTGHKLDVLVDVGPMATIRGRSCSLTMRKRLEINAGPNLMSG